MPRDAKTGEVPSPVDAPGEWPRVRTTVRPDGRVAVDGLPGVRVSNPSFLTEEFERYERERGDTEIRPAAVPRP